MVAHHNSAQVLKRMNPAFGIGGKLTVYRSKLISCESKRTPGRRHLRRPIRGAKVIEHINCLEQSNNIKNGRRCWK